MKTDGGNETERQHAARQVACDHDFATIEAVEQHARERAHRNCRNGARKQDAGHRRAVVRLLHGEAQHRDIVEVVADFAHDLSEPGVAVIAIAPQDLRELRHGFTAPGRPA